MKIKLNKQKIKEGLNIVERVSAKSISLPILKNILIKTNQNVVEFSSTDLEIGIKWWGLAKIEKEGEIIVPASIFSSSISFLPEDNVSLFSIENNLKIECGDYKTQIKGFSTDDFPIMPKVSENNTALVDSSILCEGLSHVSDIPSYSSTRPEISGVYFVFENNEIKVVSTDSYRLGEKKIKLKEKTKNNFSFILPQKTVKEIVNIFGEKEGDIKIVSGTNQVLFESTMKETKHPEINLISRKIEGDYPNYQEIIPKENKIKCILDKKEFINQIKAAGIFSGKSSEVLIKINPDKKGLEILSENSDLGEHTSFISGDIKGKKKETVSFNYRYLVDGIAKIKTKNIYFEINENSDPGVFKPTEKDDFLYIVMPIKSN